MKKVYVSPEVECINFYSEEAITTSEDWGSTEEGGFGGNMSLVGNDFSE